MSATALQIDFPVPPRSRWADRGRPLGDGGAVLLAGLVVAGAWVARPLPLWVGAAATGIGLVLRRPWLLWTGSLLLASCLGARAWAGLAPASPRPVAATVTLVTDPEAAFGSTSAIVRHDGRRLELRAREGAGGVLGQRLAGEQVRVAGRIRPPPPGSRWLQVRHVVGRLDADQLDPAGPGGPVWRAANRVRRTLASGTRSLPPRRRALFNGLVLGDDREQPATLTDDFRGAGLSHLLAVSGQNVAFVLALLGPVRRRLGLTGRWLTATAAIGAFALLTRFEPSVLRASFMAGLAVTATALGRPASTLRLLALAVAALVLIDPLLVHSVGFQLSVAASAGIVLLSPRLASALPGPSSLREALAVTLAAQLAWRRCSCSCSAACPWPPCRPTCWPPRWPGWSWPGGSAPACLPGWWPSRWQPPSTSPRRSRSAGSSWSHGERRPPRWASSGRPTSWCRRPGPACSCSTTGTGGWCAGRPRSCSSPRW